MYVDQSSSDLGGSQSESNETCVPCEAGHHADSGEGERELVNGRLESVFEKLHLSGRVVIFNCCYCCK